MAEWREAPLVERLARHAERTPEKVAVSDGAETLSYAELQARVGKAAGLLRESGVRPGDRVVFAAPSHVASAVAYFAIHRAGAIAAPVDPVVAESKLLELVARAEAAAVISETKLAAARWIDARGLGLEGQAASMGMPDPASPADLLFTSGTTGEPKGVLLSHRALSCAAENISTFVGQSGDDREAMPLPLHHSFGLGRLRCMAFCGSSLALVDGLRNPNALLVRLAGATALALVPAGFALLRRLRLGEALRATGSQLRFVELGSASLPADLREWLLETFPKARLCHHYGLTEASRVAFVELASPEGRLGSIGRASPNVELSLRDGELWVRGGMLLSEYWRDPARTQEALRDGWLRTGDLARADAQGNYFLTGRATDTINVGGLKVSPDEVEEHLRQIPGVSDAACIGIADPNGISGERVKAFLVATPEIDLATVLAALRKVGLEPHKLPVAIEHVAALPRTDSGKLKRSALRAK